MSKEFRMENKQITTITIFRFEGVKAAWMFTQMGLALSGLRKVKGLEFFRLMGSGGKNGFSKLLNPNVYAFLGVWESESFAKDFFNKSDQYLPFKRNSVEAWTIFMTNHKAHGSWSGKSPFSDFQPYSGGLVAVITRATIKLKHLPKFWSYVPAVSGKLDSQKGLIFAIGIGEYPWLMQATFSIWEDYSYMKQYAYNSKLHTDVIKITRELGWYSEELFSNFIPYDSYGTWEGKIPLLPYLEV